MDITFKRIYFRDNIKGKFVNMKVNSGRKLCLMRAGSQRKAFSVLLALRLRFLFVRTVINHFSVNISRGDISTF